MTLPTVLTGFGFNDPLERVPELSHCGNVDCTRRHFVDWHTHRCFEFTYYVSGSDGLRVGHDVHQLNTADIAFTLPHERHRSEPALANAHHLVWMGVDVDAFGQVGARLSAALRSYHGRAVPRCYDVEPIMQAVVRQVVAQGPLCESVVRELLRGFILMMTQQIQVLTSRTPARSIAPYSIMVQTVVRFMRENVDRRLTLAELCDANGIGKSVLCETFKREVGQAPAAYHLQLRLEAARLALEDPSQTILGVAMAHGFASSQHFSNSFVRQFGLTPRRWQLQARSEPGGRSVGPA